MVWRGCTGGGKFASALSLFVGNALSTTCSFWRCQWSSIWSSFIAFARTWNSIPLPGIKYQYAIKMFEFPKGNQFSLSPWESYSITYKIIVFSSPPPFSCCCFSLYGMTCWFFIVYVNFQELIGALLGCSLFCLFPVSNRDVEHLPVINFDHMFAYVSFCFLLEIFISPTMHLAIFFCFLLVYLCSSYNILDEKF